MALVDVIQGLGLPDLLGSSWDRQGEAVVVNGVRMSISGVTAALGWSDTTLHRVRAQYGRSRLYASQPWVTGESELNFDSWC